jgi:hypothetical protein
MPNIILIHCMRRIALFVMVILLSTSTTKAAGYNPIDTSNLWREMLKLEGVFRDTTHLGFNATFYLTDVDTTTNRDTIQIVYKVSNQKFKIVLDSTMIIQNDFYRVAVYDEQDVMMLTKPVQFGLNLFHVNLTDSQFNRLYVQALHATDSAGYRKLSFQFKSGSPFTQYEILYDTTNYRINRIEYNVKKNIYTSGSPDYYYHVRIVCSGYQTGTFTDSVFSMGAYFIRKEGIYSLVAPYTSYQLINSLNQ